MTYKELVNAVLVRLREDQVGSVAETDYSKLVGAFVNDAKRVVEDAWPWRSLICYADIPMTAGTNTFYDLEDYTSSPDSMQFNSRARVLIDPASSSAQLYTTTSGQERQIGLAPRSLDMALTLNYINANSSGQLMSVSLASNPTSANGKTNIRIHPYPPILTPAETLRVFVVNPNNDFTGDGEVLRIPEAPVIQLAYLYCLYERGEEIGEFPTLTSSKVEGSLSDAIMLDSGQTVQPAFEVE